MRLKPKKTEVGRGSHNSKGKNSYSPELLPLIKAPLTPSTPYFPKSRGADKGPSKETSRLDAAQRHDFSLASSHLESNKVDHLELTPNFLYIHEVYYFQLVRSHSNLRTYKTTEKQGVAYV